MPMAIKDELALIARAAPTGLVTAQIAAAEWDRPRREASRRLAALSRAGWLRRVRQGVYRIVALDTASLTVSSYDDPWTLASTLFAPCYLGGWSAAEHWGLTEQLFRDTFVVTAAPVRSKRSEAAGLTFRLARVPRSRAIGDYSVWRGAARVSCSSRELTLVDGATAPAWVGGVRHLAEMVRRYAEGTEQDLPRLARCLDQVGSGAGAKRLGFIAATLLEGRHNENAVGILEFIRQLGRQLRTSGVVKLDPAVSRRGRMNTGWGLWVNVRLTDQ
jgi:predicted transcriptional regulator of viral defense system